MIRKICVFVLTALLILSVGSASRAENALPNTIKILYTNDVHCTLDDAVGYAGLAAYKRELKDAGNEVLLVDIGDAVQSGAVGIFTKGAEIVSLMNEVGYELAIPGNHEFDYGMDRFFELVEMADYDYISANFTLLASGEPVLDAYRILSVGGLKIAFVGVSTPNTITSSTPAYFQNGNGEYIYSFCQDSDGTALYTCVQKAVDCAIAEGADYVIALAHLGIDESASPWMSTQLIANTNGIDAVLDGHSHSVMQEEWVLNKDGRPVLLSSTGTGLEYIGCLTVTPEGMLTSALIGAEYAEKDEKITALIEAIKAKNAELLEQVVAFSEVILTIYEPGTDVRIIRNAETNLGDLCTDAYRAVSGADVAIINGGGIRASVAEGNVTYNDILSVHPFGNRLCMVEATGQEILDALEMGARAVPGENGGFLQVSGLCYQIDTAIETSVVLDENGMFAGVTGRYRVGNVTVDGEPLDLKKTYTLASHNNLLCNGGDGMTMFMDNVFLLENTMLDNQVLMTYIKDTLCGTIGEEYSDPYGNGRITVKNGAE